MLRNFFNRMQPATLAGRVLVRVAISVAIVIAGMTAVTYYYVANTVKSQHVSHLEKYIIERTQREHDIFQLAENNHAVLKREVLSRLQYYGNSDPQVTFNNKVSRFPDGTHRTTLKNFDGSREAFVFIGKDVKIDADIRRRVMVFMELSQEFGRAWHHKFQNLYFTTPENILVGYWPEVPDWAHNLPADMYMPNEEYVWIADKKHNPDRMSVWTGLFHDIGSKKWMSSLETPVDIDGRHISTIGHDLTLNELYERTINDHLDGAYNFIIHKDGRLIVHPDMARLTGVKQELSEFDFRNNSHIEHIYPAILNNKTRNHVIELEAYDEYIAVGYMEHPEWYFVSVIPRSIITAAAFDAASVILLLGLISLVIELIIFFLIINRHIKKPLRKILKGVQRVADGELDIKLDVNYDYELKALSTAFNNMTVSLLQHEKQLQFSVNMSRAMTSALSTYVTQQENIRIIFNQMLDDILRITDSEFGFIGEIRYENDTPYVKTHAITDISWDDVSRQRYTKFAGEGVEFHDLNTLYGEAIRTQSAVISNDPQHDVRSAGLRDGHPPLHAFLGVPLILGDNMVGMVGIANRPGGYSQELVNSLEPLFTTCASVIDAVQKHNEAKLVEQALAYEQERLRATFEQAAVGMAHIALDGKWIKVNAKLADITGYTVAELLAMSVDEITHPDDIEKIHTYMEQMTRGEIREFATEKRYINKDASTAWVHVTVSLIYGNDEEPGHFISIINDISDKILAREELYDAVQLLDNIIEHLPVMIFLKHADDLRFKLVNTAGEKLLGIKRSELIGRNDYDFFPNQQAEFFTGVDRSVLARNTLLDIPEEKIDTPQGTRILHTRKIALRNRYGKTEYLLGISEDITEQKLLENELEGYRNVLEEIVDERTAELVAARDLADKANSAKSEFLSRMSHELRTPLNAILGFGQLLGLDAEKMTADQSGNVTEIIDAGNHLLTLINEVLDLAKIESGKIEVKLTNVRLDDLLMKCISLIENSANERGIEIINHVNGNYSVQADEVRIKQVLLNLLINAVNYNSPQGKIILTCKKVAGDRLRLCITDTGAGLSKEELDKLFTAFERLPNAAGIKGSGIGLVISQHLVELMSGAIGAESTPGEGSTFWVELMPGKAA